MRKTLFLLPLLASSLSAQAAPDSVAWRKAMAHEVAAFLRHDAPQGGIRIVAADSTAADPWTAALVSDVVAAYDSLGPNGDAMQHAVVTFSAPMEFEQPFGGFPRELIQVRMEETTCIFAGGGQGYLSGAVYHVRLFIRGGKLLTDIDSQGQPEGTCSQ